MKNDLFPIPAAEDVHASTRKQIQEHPNFAVWYTSLAEDTRTAFEMLFLTDVTPELILFARQLSETELWQSVFLRVISSGNPQPIEKAILTQHALLTVIADIEALGRRHSRLVA
ncbi:MAG TPA: hypothetical protein VK206_14930 [Anaerolineales bacterium]|nr:hypothetical protein [Anaerolineales bacterium]